MKSQLGVSVGQGLAIGYTFLTTLLGTGKHSFPLIVDSPAGALDRKIRTEIGKLVPTLCDQFVAFTISTERMGFVDSLKKHSKNGIQYLTLFRKTKGTEQLLEKLPKVNSTETEASVLVSGENYFNKFDISEES